MIRIGQGWDRHTVGPDRPFVLGGVVIPWTRGLVGHSDADVLLHAVIDALLGALALGDIGQWFPDTDPSYAGADSAQLLRHVLASPGVAPWCVSNLDATVIAQQPRLAPHLPDVCNSIACLLGIAPGQVSVKAKTGEGVGPTGRGEAVEALCVLLLEERADAR